MKNIIALVAFSFSFVFASSQDNIKAYPTHWWTGMKLNKIQLMLRGDQVGNASKATISYPGVSLTKVTRVANKNYLFLDLTISSSAKPGTFQINLPGNKKIPFQLKQRSRDNGKTRIKGQCCFSKITWTNSEPVGEGKCHLGYQPACPPG